MTGKGSIKKTAVLKMAGKAASHTALNQLEGGDGLKDSCTAAAVMAVPAMDAAKAGKYLCRLKAAKIKEQKIRKVQAISRIKQREFGMLKKIKDNYPKMVLSMDKVDFSQDGIIHKNIIDWLLERK